MTTAKRKTSGNLAQLVSLDMSTHIWLGSDFSISNLLEARERIHAHVMSGADLPRIEQLGDQDFGEMNDMIETHGPLAIMNISGTLVPRAPHWYRYFGVVGYNTLREGMLALQNNAAIKEILLNVDSPGGSATGISEVSDLMLEIRKDKPISTYTGTVMASGGYWLGSVGKKIYADRLATVGSIGVITVHTEITEMLKEMGVDAKVFRAGKFKALGTPYEKRTDQAEEKINHGLNVVYGLFTQTVAKHRGKSQADVEKNMADGREFIGAEAVGPGLVDSIDSFDSVVKSILARHNPGQSTSTNATSHLTGAPMAKKKVRVLTEQGSALVAAGGLSEEAALADPKYSVETEVDDTPTGESEGDTPDKNGKNDQEDEDNKDNKDVQAGAPAPAAPAAAAAPAAPAGQVSVEVAIDAALKPYKEQVASLQSQLTAAQVAANEANAKVASMEAGHAAMRGVVELSIQRLQIGLKQPVASLAGVSADALVLQFNQLNAEMQKRFPTAQVSAPPATDDGAGKQNETGVTSARVAGVHPRKRI